MKLWIGNIAPGTTDEEIRELLGKYAPTLACRSVQRVDGDGSRPAALLELENPDFTATYQAQARLHGLYWKQRELFVQVMRD
jgi:RNA recognition motif-containing protein